MWSVVSQSITDAGAAAAAAPILVGAHDLVNPSMSKSVSKNCRLDL